MPQDELCSLTSWLLCFQILDQLLWQPLEPALQLMHSPRPLLSLVAGLGMIALSRAPLGTGVLTTQKDEDVLFSFQLSFCCLQPVPQKAFPVVSAGSAHLAGLGGSSICLLQKVQQSPPPGGRRRVRARSAQ